MNSQSFPEKSCAFCKTPFLRKTFSDGGREPLKDFLRRKYCDRKCMADAFEAKPEAPKTADGSRYHARKAVAKGACEKCGKPNAGDVHHKDGNPMNNSLDNLQRTCRSCHMKAHHSKPPCVICGKPQECKGFCNKHYHRFKKYGDPLFTKYNVPETKRPPTITPAVLAARAKHKKWEVSSALLSVNQRKARREQSS